MEVIVEEGCRTPRHSKCQILADLACPPAPKKKKVGYVMKQRDPPMNGYIQPPDLEFLFTIAPRREAFAWT
ncbi:cyclin-dependent protein kinase inhibitor SMR4-like [Quercus suber]|uniref:Cyclin-dependent protein kinase inhibitor smr4 n=1 Tax=Quercus suber TaxID=58331 RepID=A0AAW0L6Y3_QUESU|nr:cyclin-dependent protein kinase inhibitor SMR4-like [Quercus suber]